MKNFKKIIIVTLVTICIIVVLMLLFNNKLTSTKFPSKSQADSMQKIYNEFYGPPLGNTNTISYFKQLVNLGWNESSFRTLLSNSSELAATQIQFLNSGRPQKVLLNIGVGEAQSPRYATTIFYRQNGQYGVIINLHLERSPTTSTSVKFWSRDYAYPLNHEMRHVKRFFESGIFNDYQTNNDLDSNTLYPKYLQKLLSEYNIPVEFNSTSTVASIDELGIVLETDDPKEIALNIDRLNSFTLDILKNDEDLGVSKVAPIYLEQIVLARHLLRAYEKPSIQRLNYTIRTSAFDQMNLFSTTFKDELYRAYPNDTKAMQNLEAIYEGEANKAIMENAN
ncbi:MAG: hypothetical protein KKE50_03055 [Nanoarchaeota archaeon]|nr:hypothetical protein [Nanoarchaeota archaeon]